MARRLALVFGISLCLIVAALPAAAGTCLLFVCVEDPPPLPPAPTLPPLPTLPPVLPAPDGAGLIEKLPISGLEDLLMTKVNAERTSSGLGALQNQSWARGIARSHAEAMAAAGNIWHNPAYMAQGRKAMSATLLGENVGMAGSITSVHRALMNSPSHKDNILQGEFSHAGIGVAIKGETVYVTQAFARIPGGAAPRPVAGVAKPAAARQPAGVAAGAPINAPPPPSTIVMADSEEPTDPTQSEDRVSSSKSVIEPATRPTSDFAQKGAAGGAIAALLASVGLLAIKLISAKRLILS